MLVLINKCLLNVVFSMTKTLKGQSSHKQNFYYPHLQYYLENSASLNACFPLFHFTSFISNLIKIQLIQRQLGICGLCANQI